MSRNWCNTTITIDCAKCPLRQDAALPPELRSGWSLSGNPDWRCASCRRRRRSAPRENRRPRSSRSLPAGPSVTSCSMMVAGRSSTFAFPAISLDLAARVRKALIIRLKALPTSCCACSARCNSTPQCGLILFLAALVRRIVRSEEGAAFEHLVDVGRRNALEAVGHLLLELYLRQRRGRISKDCSCKFPVTQVLLADALGLTAMHVNRVLRQLREGGLVSISNHSLVIHDIDGLTELCEFNKDYTTRMPVI